MNPIHPDSPPCVLTVAGSDSGGGAGIQADLKTFMMQGTYGLSVVTALTAQNTTAVTAIEAPSPGFVAAQLDAVLADFPIRAAKTGMLFSAPIIEAAAGRLAGTGFPWWSTRCASASPGPGFSNPRPWTPCASA